ncbi:MULTISPECIES: right-handed parallel beta-helix repeat-containing protein [Maribacter]|uniref:Right-handed parallel beta-helix repeat-containing protein n=1 Tax=Maribacter flavus TaxID=1658664 RepID=A0ABU7IM28_9FLAO|nr:MULTISPECIES: right-handed parallel beta-helix repeat-containing protein [Maribacter]MDC6406901.1 right-handed parallel beta-helix repeat-containing protein [Maribacter sp. PR66]MEE1974019.1 right-handed parallel beta-helix repeat-containing protein [Maribacter flavus]
MFKINANNTQIRNLSVYANNNAGIRIDGGSIDIQNNLLGVSASGVNAGNIDIAVENLGGNLLVDSNYIATTTDSGILINGGTSNIIQNNHITSNGDAACDDNILINGGSGIVIQQNLIENAASLGIDAASSLGNIIISDNTITGSGQNGGNCSGGPEDMGIKLAGSDSQITNNVIYGNGGAGITLVGSGSGNLISRNSFYANGTNAPALGIDILGDGVTLNDLNDADGGPNGSLNFPIISGVYGSATSLTVEGWSRPGATLEFFTTDINEGNASTGDNQLGLLRDYGEGQVYIATLVEGSGSDQDSNVLPYTDMDGNTDNTNKLKFTIPLPPGVTIGELITATATLSNSTSEFSPLSEIRANSLITNKRITYRIKKN